MDCGEFGGDGELSLERVQTGFHQQLISFADCHRRGAKNDRPRLRPRLASNGSTRGLGIPTASEFSRIVTPTGRASTAAEGYTAELLAEWALGYPIKQFGGNEWTERGKDLEPDARAYYALQRPTSTPQPSGSSIGTSTSTSEAPPMHWSAPVGCLELKCPRADTHLLYLVRGVLPKDHFSQVQGVPLGHGSLVV